jgi:hypothetical protein
MRRSDLGGHPGNAGKESKVLVETHLADAVAKKGRGRFLIHKENRTGLSDIVNSP